jgi:two-component system, chemotaxis family, protein-glutamate methylesterase/glutaminase
MTNPRKIKVMIVEDSSVKAKLLTEILNSDPEITVTDIAGSGKEALLKLENNRPDLITMDVEMPGMDGFETTDKILLKYSIPIIIITSLRNKNNSEQLHKAMRESGSLHLLDSPPGPWSPDFENHAKKIVRMVKLLSTTKIITRHRGVHTKKKTYKNHTENINTKLFNVSPRAVKRRNNNDKIKLVAIGVSTGGPTVLQKILSALPEEYPLPILIVQHISVEFDKIFVSYLKTSCSMDVKIAENNEKIKGGVIYIAPGDKDMQLTQEKTLLIKKLHNKKILHPSIAVFFESVAVNCGKHALGIILTGMGTDGAKELRQMRDKGAATIAQEKESCVVFGMPREAIKLGAAEEVLTPEEIIVTLIDIGRKFGN